LRNTKEIIKDIVRKPPMLFPLVALFHVLWFAWTIWDDRHEPFPDMAWLQVLWLAGYTIFWLAACDLRKWGALGYIMLTILDSSIFLAVRYHKLPFEYISNLCLIDGLFSFFLLFYYKRFN
jgi:hypothetical protein